MRTFRQELGRVSIDRCLLAVASAPCMEIAAQCQTAGFPLNLGLYGPERWHDESWRWDQFGKAAESIGATWWAIDEDRGDDLVIRWGVHVTGGPFPANPWHYERRIFHGTAAIKIAAIEQWLGYPLEDEQRAQVIDGPQVWAKPVPGPDPEDDS